MASMNKPMRSAVACLLLPPLCAAAFSAQAAGEDKAAATEVSVTDKFRMLRPDFYVSPQIAAADIAAAAQEGFTLIVNNRPDGEMFGQPKSADLEAAAKAAGVSYVHIRVDGRGLSEDHISALKKALNEAGGKALAFCASGTRSTYLQAFLAASEGRAPDEIIAEARAAGYDVSGARRTLEALGADHQED